MPGPRWRTPAIRRPHCALPTRWRFGLRLALQRAARRAADALSLHRSCRVRRSLSSATLSAPTTATLSAPTRKGPHLQPPYLLPEDYLTNWSSSVEPARAVVEAVPPATT